IPARQRRSKPGDCACLLVLSRWLKQYGSEVVNGSKANAFIRSDGGGIVIVDVERHHWDEFQCTVNDGGHGRCSAPLPACVGTYPDTLNLNGFRSDDTEVGFKPDRVLLRFDHGMTLGDELTNAQAVSIRAICQGSVPKFLGDHG